MFKIVLFFILSVLCVVHTLCDDGCRHSRSYTRVKRGKYYSSPPRFYNRPPMTFPIKGPFSFTPPPFMQDDEPPYPSSRPYKVSKRPTNEGLGDADINNLVKHLSKQDLDKILEFAHDKDKYSDKSKDTDYNYNRPFRREHLQKPSFNKEFYQDTMGMNTKYQEEKPYEVEFKQYVNFVTEGTPVKYSPQDDRQNTNIIGTEVNRVHFYGPQSPQKDRPSQFKLYVQDERPTQFKAYVQDDTTRSEIDQFKVYAQDDQRSEIDATLTRQNFVNHQVSDASPSSTNPFLSETNEEEKLPQPDNMRPDDFVVSYTNNVPTVAKADSPSYDVENFGTLPLMDYNSKLHSVSSYHVPHYTVTQPKSPPSSSPVSFSSSKSYSSSPTLLKPSPAAASVKAPPFEPAPPPSAAKEQSDAHLKATKIWSHKSKGAAYTLHDDGTLTPEWPRPKYG